MNNARLRMFARAAVIAALYTVLTLAIPVASYGQIQVRISEALMILPVFTPAAVPGLFVGCVLANALGALLGLTAAWDILFGSVATLLAAVCVRLLRKQPFWLYMLPAVVFNGVIVGVELSVFYALPLWATMGYVALGEAISCYVLGYPLSKAAQRLDKVWN